MADSASPSGSSDYRPVTQDNKLSLTQQVSNSILHRQSINAQTAPTISGTIGQPLTSLWFIGGNSTVMPGSTSALYGSGGGSPMISGANGSSNSISGGGWLVGNAYDQAQFNVGGSNPMEKVPEPQTLAHGSTVTLSDNTLLTYIDLRHLTQ